jgi:hypothetical protein
LRNTQARLPKKLYDYTRYEKLIDDTIEMESKKSDHVFAKIFYDDLLVLYCGKYVQYGRLIPNPKKKSKKSPKEVMDLILEQGKDKKKSILKDMNVHLSKSVEIVKLTETTSKNIL